MAPATGKPHAPALVILAAGASRRMGTCKALVDLNGRTPLEHLLQAGACFGEALIVTGRHDTEIRAFLSANTLPPHHVTTNQSWEAGRTGSVQHAAAHLPDRDLCIAPVDCPLVPAEVFETLLATWLGAASPDGGWLSPRIQVASQAEPRHGHPVILGHGLLSHITHPSQPLRQLRELATSLLSISVTSPTILDNLDTPTALSHHGHFPDSSFG